MSLQIDLVYVIIALVALGLILFFVLRKRTRDTEHREQNLGIEAERRTVGDVLTGTPQAVSQGIVDAISDEEPEVPTLSPIETKTDVPLTPSFASLETSTEVPAPTPEVFVDVPKVAPTRPEPAREIRPLAPQQGRHRAHVDPMLEACVLLTPKEGCFTGEKLARIAELIEAAALPVAVSTDFFDAHIGSWIEDCSEAVGCTAVYVSMQLASRSKLADEVLLSEFLQLGNQIAIAVDAEVELPDVVNALTQVQRLGQLIAQFDNTLALTIRCENSIDTDRLQEIVENHGLQEKAPKVYEKCQKGTKTPYLRVKLAGQAEDELLLEWDIPLCDPAIAPLSSFFAFANDLSCGLNGVLVDASGNVIGSPAASYIEAELRKLAGAMSRYGVAPGSARAMKLFSR